MRKLAVLMSTGACAVAVLTTGGCDSAPPGATDPPATDPPATVPRPGPDPAPGERTEAAPAPDAGEQASWTMPDLVGGNLQDAQDQIQALTGDVVFYTASHDLSGQDRNQVVDSNWRVCTQNIAPSAVVTAASRIDLGVVKVDETCP